MDSAGGNDDAGRGGEHVDHHELAPVERQLRGELADQRVGGQHHGEGEEGADGNGGIGQRAVAPLASQDKLGPVDEDDGAEDADQ